MNSLTKIFLFFIFITSCNYSFFVPKDQLIKEINGYVIKQNNETFFITSNNSDFKFDSGANFEILHLDFNYSKINKDIINNLADTLYLNNCIQINGSKYLLTSYLKIRYFNERKYVTNDFDTWFLLCNFEVTSVNGEIISITPLTY